MKTKNRKPSAEVSERQRRAAKKAWITIRFNRAMQALKYSEAGHKSWVTRRLNEV